MHASVEIHRVSIREAQPAASAAAHHLMNSVHTAMLGRLCKRFSVPRHENGACKRASDITKTPRKEHTQGHQLSAAYETIKCAVYHPAACGIPGPAQQRADGQESADSSTRRTKRCDQDGAQDAKETQHRLDATLVADFRGRLDVATVACGCSKCLFGVVFVGPTATCGRAARQPIRGAVQSRHDVSKASTRLHTGTGAHGHRSSLGPVHRSRCVQGR